MRHDENSDSSDEEGNQVQIVVVNDEEVDQSDDESLDGEELDSHLATAQDPQEKTQD